MTDSRNEMTMLQKLGDTLDPDLDAPPVTVRDRVLAAATAIARQQAVRPRVAQRQRQLAWRVALTAGLAASLAVGLALLPHHPRSTSPAGTSSAATAPAVVGAATVLHNAALAALKLPTHAPRPNQFVFTEYQTSGDATTTITREIKHGPPMIRQTWRSADGTRDGLLRERPQAGGAWEQTALPGCREGAPPDGPSACQLVPGYRTDLPTDGAAMLVYLRSIAAKPQTVSPSDKDYDGQANSYVFKMAADLILGTYLAPRVLAAIFDALAALPGVRIVQHAVDTAGRTGIGVTLGSASGISEAFIFNPETYAFNGWAVIGSSPAQGESLMRTAIVDEVGQLP
ncbi:MAG: CU044_5270 family protein [Pseudonocardiales bacterium]